MIFENTDFEKVHDIIQYLEDKSRQTGRATDAVNSARNARIMDVSGTRLPK